MDRKKTHTNPWFIIPLLCPVSIQIVMSSHLTSSLISRASGLGVKCATCNKKVALACNVCAQCTCSVIFCITYKMLYLYEESRYYLLIFCPYLTLLPGYSICVAFILVHSTQTQRHNTYWPFFAPCRFLCPIHPRQTQTLETRCYWSEDL